MEPQTQYDGPVNLGFQEVVVFPRERDFLSPDKTRLLSSFVGQPPRRGSGTNHGVVRRLTLPQHVPVMVTPGILCGSIG